MGWSLYSNKSPAKQINWLGHSQNVFDRLTLVVTIITDWFGYSIGRVYKLVRKWEGALKGI